MCVYVSIYLSIYLSIYESIYAYMLRMYVCIYAWTCVRIYGCMYVCMYVCMHLYVCMCVYMYVGMHVSPHAVRSGVRAPAKHAHRCSAALDASEQESMQAQACMCGSCRLMIILRMRTQRSHSSVDNTHMLTDVPAFDDCADANPQAQRPPGCPPKHR